MARKMLPLALTIYGNILTLLCIGIICWCCNLSSGETTQKDPQLGPQKDLCDLSNNTWTGDCLTELFAKYGSGDKIGISGFGKLLENVGLGTVHDIHDVANSSKADVHLGPNPSAYTQSAISQLVSPDAKRNGNKKYHHRIRGQHAGHGAAGSKHRTRRDVTSAPSNAKNSTGQETNSTHAVEHPDHHVSAGLHSTECLSPNEILNTLSVLPADGITPIQFLHVCPILLQQLDSHACVIYDVHRADDGHNHSTGSPSANTPTEAKAAGALQVWGYAIGAVTMISVASVTCIMMVPCIQRFPVAYGRLLSYLVAMAVGTLSGDSILHLLPHAFGIHGHKEETTTTTSAPHSHAVTNVTNGTGHASEADSHVVVWRGSVVLLGIFSFFIFEQFMRMCQNQPRKRLHSKQASVSNHNASDVHGSQEIGERLCNHLESGHELVPMMHHDCEEVAVVTQTTKSNNFAECTKETKLSQDLKSNSGHLSNSSSLDMEDHGSHTSISKKNGITDTHPPKQRKESHDSHHSHGHHHHHHGHHHHGHSHAHLGKSGISAIAWMVVMGDGMHNFTDGLVVGAAFADSLAGGLSTAIAVMCHEIPHELGDFAVMLRGGMSIKQALGFQAVSSILAYIGMAIGIAIGNISTVSLWVFALAGGMFLYIALTDLFPEMVESMNHTSDSKPCHLVMQTLGAICGVGAMMVIALYEDSLMDALS